MFDIIKSRLEDGKMSKFPASVVLSLKPGARIFPKITPIIPVRRRDIFESADWLYEIKHDGFSALAYLDRGQRRFVSRRGIDMKRFKDLAALVAKELKVRDAILDGEIVSHRVARGLLKGFTSSCKADVWPSRKCARSRNGRLME